MSNDCSLKDTIAQLLEKRRLKPIDLARAAGVAPSSANSWMTGATKQLKGTVAQRLCDKLKISL